jgi:signal transduction histidine kinase
MRELRLPGGGSLRESLESLTRAFAADTGVRVHLRYRLRQTLTPRQDAEIYHVVREALANVRQHARATDVDIALSEARGRVHLAVSDNGRGFSDRTRRRDRFGLVGMRERAAALGGRLRVMSAPRKGTRVAVSFPIGDHVG